MTSMPRRFPCRMSLPSGRRPMEHPARRAVWPAVSTGKTVMHSIIYFVGLVVVVLAILSFLGFG